MTQDPARDIHHSPNGQQSLGLVIPVKDDAERLHRLLGQCRAMDIFDQVVVVDDGSAEPIHAPGATVIRSNVSQGPGVARNRGIAALETSHLLCFDSDDLFTPELPRLWQDLKDEDFDFCLFRHCDSQQERAGLWGLDTHDAALWQEAGMGGRALTPISESARAILARTANFPWNKIWRLSAWRADDIRYSATPPHEDILAHWMGFATARRILASDRVAAVHYVSTGGNRLTNWRGRRRLGVFDPLNEAVPALFALPPERAALALSFWRFSADLLDWVRGNLDCQWHDELDTRQRAFWRDNLPASTRAEIEATDPALAANLRRQMDGAE